MSIEAGFSTIAIMSTTGLTGSYTGTCSRAVTLDRSVDLTDITTLCDVNEDLTNGLSPARRRLAQFLDAGISLEGHYDPDNANQSTNLRPGSTVYIVIGIDTTGNGSIDSVVINSKMIVENVNLGFDIENPTSFSAQCQNAGAIKYTGEFYNS